MSNFLFTRFFAVPVNGASGPLLNTNGKLLILASAAASVVCIATWLSHLLLFKMVTAPANLILSINLGVTGKSALSIAMLYLVLRANALGVRYALGLFME